MVPNMFEYQVWVDGVERPSVRVSNRQMGAFAHNKEVLAIGKLIAIKDTTRITFQLAAEHCWPKCN